jgi:hypothetical protein
MRMQVRKEAMPEATARPPLRFITSAAVIGALISVPVNAFATWLVPLSPGTVIIRIAVTGGIVEAATMMVFLLWWQAKRKP